MTNKEQLTKLKELKEKVERDIIESKTLAETLMFTILYRAIEEECKELEIKKEEENKPTIEEIRLKAISKELIKIDFSNISCVGVPCSKCAFKNCNNDCLLDFTEQAYKKAEYYLNKLENK